MSLDPDRPAVRIRRRWLVITLALATSTKEAADAEGLAFFESRIRPALAEHSDRCHSGRTPRNKGGLRNLTFPQVDKAQQIPLNLVRFFDVPVSSFRGGSPRGRPDPETAERRGTRVGDEWGIPGRRGGKAA